MLTARRLDCEKEAADCRFIIQSKNEDEVTELAKTRMKDAHEQEFTDDELRNELVERV